ncbi:MAG: DNA-deoxyinosine glycosylase [Syntrophaceae bacterium]|nr:DNA-deoxyinosine glycosylase [Syntrophaceae bacterium]
MQNNSSYKKIVHPFEPVYNSESRILILGSLPSIKSRENNFYYGHPQNRFWRVIAKVLGEQSPATIEEKRALLLSNGIALWDVVASCDIIGSSDSSVRNVVPNNLSVVLKNTKVSRIYANGGTAEKLYNKYCLPHTNLPIIKLPSTSPANARWSLERLIEAWRVVSVI